METTENLALPYILPSQAQKHVTHNEALRALDAIVQLSAISDGLATPPAEPEASARYIVAAGAIGEWAGHENDIAIWQDGGWAFHAPLPGWLCHVADAERLVVYNGSQWEGAGGPNAALATLGINNAVADGTNRIAVNGAATLFNHDGSGHQLKVNKAAEGDTASVLFQTGFSARAEFGLTGDDNWHVKVSPDGSVWTEALVIDRTNGYVGVGTDVPEQSIHAVADGSASFLQLDSYGVNCQIRGRSANGSRSAPEAVSAEKLLATFTVSGHDGSAFTPATGLIGFFAQEAFSASELGTYFRIDTTAPGGTSRTEKLRITGEGDVGIGMSAPTAKLHVEGPLRCGGYAAAGRPSAAAAGSGTMIYDTDLSKPVWSDGAVWRDAAGAAV